MGASVVQMQPSYFATTLIVVEFPLAVCSKFPNCPHPLKQPKETVRSIAWLTFPVVGPSTLVTGAFVNPMQLFSSPDFLQPGKTDARNPKPIKTHLPAFIIDFILRQRNLSSRCIIYQQTHYVRERRAMAVQGRGSPESINNISADIGQLLLPFF